LKSQAYSLDVTSSPFDALASADFLVTDRDAAVAWVQRALGMGQPKPSWSHGGPGRGFKVTFCRAHPSLDQSPTLVELIEPAELDPRRPLGEVVPNVNGLAALQGDRPLKTHGMPVASAAVDELVERVRSRNLRHWVQPSSESYPFSRLWMGISSDDLAGYLPGSDGGLMIEVVPTVTLRVPVHPPDEPPSPPPPGPGGMLRTESRGVLVEDIDRSLEELVEAFSWEPDVGPERGDDGSRRAVLGFGMPNSARIELLAPAPDGEVGQFLRRWGSGVWHVRIAVDDLTAKAADLRTRGTTFREVRTGFEYPETVLRVDLDATPGCLFEFSSGPPPSP
jgi:hypothetical protein